MAYSLFVASLHEGYGRHFQFLTYENIVNIWRFLFFMKLFGNSGVTLIRFSIALQLLPFSTAIAWKAALWGIVALEVASLFALILYKFLHVHPISANWDGSDDGGEGTMAYTFIGKIIESKGILPPEFSINSR